jgi:phage FluMu protein Com
MIKFQCSQCGKKIGVKSEAAGKRVRCPRCTTVNAVPVPAPVDEPPAEAYNPLLEALAQDSQRQSAAPEPPAIEEVAVAAPPLPPPLPPVRSAPPRRAAAAKTRGGGAYADDTLTGGDMLLMIFCNGIAFILGIVWAVQGNPKGVKMIIGSVIVSMIFGGIGAAIRLSMGN